MATRGSGRYPSKHRDNSSHESKFSAVRASSDVRGARRYPWRGSVPNQIAPSDAFTTARTAVPLNPSRLPPNPSGPLLARELLQRRVAADPQRSHGASKDRLSASRKSFGAGPAFPLIGAQPASEAEPIQADPYRPLAVFEGASGYAHKQSMLCSDSIPTGCGSTHQPMTGGHQKRSVDLQI